MLEARAQQTAERNAKRIQELTTEVEEYLKRKQQEMDALKAETNRVREQCAVFAARREAEEKRLAELVSPFLEGKPNPVTIGGKQPPEKPPSA
jgi:hypothetical protein